MDQRLIDLRLIRGAFPCPLDVLGTTTTGLFSLQSLLQREEQLRPTWGRFSLMQPLSMRRLEHEKRRKEIKEQWHRAQRKLVSDRAGFVLPGMGLSTPWQVPP